MERKRNKLIIAFIIAMIPFRLFADNRSDIYSAYVNNRMDQWKNVIDRMQAANPTDNTQLLELVNYQYGYIGYRLPLLNAYKSAFYAFRISLSTISAPFNGPKSLNYAKKSVENDSRNYFGYTQLGNAYFYMPAAFGGSKKTAFEYFDKARKLMEEDPSLTKGNWNYLSLLVTIAQSYAYMEQFDKAKAEYENILKIEPGFLYVKDDLYPKLLAKMKKQ